jgi:hypothetical protein
LACFDIGRTDVATLPKVAAQAGICQIVHGGQTPVLPSDDVVYVVR